MLNVALQQKLIWNIWIIYVFLVLFAVEYLNWFTHIWGRHHPIESQPSKQSFLFIGWKQQTFAILWWVIEKIVLNKTICNICFEKVRSGWHKFPTIVTSHWVVNISLAREFKILQNWPNKWNVTLKCPPCWIISFIPSLGLPELNVK